MLSSCRRILTQIPAIHVRASQSGVCYFSNTTATSNKRTDFEEEFHLARKLSRYQIDPEEQRQWEAIARKFPTPRWKIPLSRERMFSPGYEMDAFSNVHDRSYNANVLLEIRDVRLPASTHNPGFARLARHRLHLICYTHADLIDDKTRDRVEEWTLDAWPESRSIFVDTNQTRPSNDLPYDLLYDSLLQHLEDKGGTNTALTVGVPNTGKSSVLMALIRLARQREAIPKKVKAFVQAPISKKSRRQGKQPKRVITKKHAIEIEDKPGKTRDVTEYLLREKPRAFFLDVPGMTPPHFFFQERPEAWWGYGAANLLLTGKHITDDLTIQTGFCAYVLNALNRDFNFGYVKKLHLDGPTYDINAVLKATKRGFTKKDDYDDSGPSEKLLFKRCEAFLKLFNTGNFGPVILDDLSIPYQPFVFQDHHFQRQPREQKSRKKGYGNDDFDNDDDMEWGFDDRGRRGNNNGKKKFNDDDFDNDSGGDDLDWGFDDRDHDGR